MDTLDQLLQHIEYARDITLLSTKLPTRVYGSLHDTQNLLIFVEDKFHCLHLEWYTPAHPPQIMPDIEAERRSEEPRRRKNIRFAPFEERYAHGNGQHPLQDTMLHMLYCWKTNVGEILGDTTQKRSSYEAIKIQNELDLFDRLTNLYAPHMKNREAGQGPDLAIVVIRYDHTQSDEYLAQQNQRIQRDYVLNAYTHLRTEASLRNLAAALSK